MSSVACKICNIRISRGKLKYNNINKLHSNIMQKHILPNYREVSLAQTSIPCTSKSTEPVYSQVLLQRCRIKSYLYTCNYDINDPCAKAICIKYRYNDC